MACANRREERKAQLKAAAQDMKQTGKAEAAFTESQYSVGDDKSPNIHTRVSYIFSLAPPRLACH